MIKLATINLESADPQRAKRFYIQLLSLTEDTRRSHGDAFVYLQSEGCDLTIATPEAPGTPGRTIELGFETDDLASAEARFRAAGVTIQANSMGWGDAFETRDPDGHRVVVYALKRGEAPG